MKMKSWIAQCAIVLAIAGATTYSFAAEKEDTPFAIPGGTYVTTDQAKALLDKGATFIDARGKPEYVEKHIKGAIHVFYKEKDPSNKMIAKTDPADEFDISKLPQDKNALLVFYCNGSPCWKGYKGATLAIKQGYKNVNWYRDGMEGVASKKLPSD